MTDFEYDCYRKKNIAHSAMKRKCGSKSKKCSLSTDHMTNKEWKERCGQVMSYNIGKPMLWAEFCKLPKDLQEEYMKGLIDKFSANAKTFAEMFGVSAPTVARYIKKNNLGIEFLKGRYPRGEKGDAFKRFMNGDAAVEVGEVVLETSAETSITDPAEPVVANEFEEELVATEPAAKMNNAEVAIPKTHLDSFIMNFSGEVNVDMVANSLRYILSGGGRAKIQIICELE